MDFDAYRKKMIFDNIISSNLQNQQYERDMMNSYVTNQPLVKPIQPPMPFLSSHTNSDRYAYHSMNSILGSGVAEDNVIRGILKRNAEIRKENKEELEADDSGLFDREDLLDDSSQKQSLELYFNELQDGGFGGTDINRENTRKALFNLKSIGLSLDLRTIKRFEKIVNEFIDSFILSVQNPQFSELLTDADKPQDVKPAKRIEILKTSLKNLDSVENILRILKVLDVLEETYDTQDIRREPIFEARFNDIIEAKPTQFIPQKLRALIVHANKEFDKIKDEVQGIYDIRGDKLKKSDRERIDKQKLLDVSRTIIDKFESYLRKQSLQLFNKVKKSHDLFEQEVFFEFELNDDKFINYLEKFFKTKQIRAIVSKNLSNFTLTLARRNALIELVNGEGDTEKNINTISKSLMQSLNRVYNDVKAELLAYIHKRSRKPEPKIKPKLPHGEPAQPIQPPKPAVTPPPLTPSQAPIPKTTTSERNFLNGSELLEQIKSKMKPLGAVHPQAKISKITPTTNLLEAEKQRDEAVELLKSKRKSKNVKAQQKIAVQNAQMIVDSILQNRLFKMQHEQLQDVSRNLNFDDAGDGQAFQPPRKPTVEQLQQDMQEQEGQPSALSRAEELVRDMRELARQEQSRRKQAGEEEQKGQEKQKGQGKMKRKVNKKGGVKLSKSSRPDSEHLSRLKALLK